MLLSKFLKKKKIPRKHHISIPTVFLKSTAFASLVEYITK